MASEKRIVHLNVAGMSCGGCENAVKTILENSDGVKSAKADHTKGTAIIELAGTDADLNSMVQKLTEGNYPASIAS